MKPLRADQVRGTGDGASEPSAGTATISERIPRDGHGDGALARPRLVFFHSKASGRSRRVEGYLSQVLQRRRNHESFELLNVDVDANAQLAEHFAIDEIPTIVVVQNKRVKGRLVSPRGCRDIEQLLAPWLK